MDSNETVGLIPDPSKTTESEQWKHAIGLVANANFLLQADDGGGRSVTCTFRNVKRISCGFCAGKFCPRIKREAPFNRVRELGTD